MLLDAIGDRLCRKTLHRVIHLQPSQGRQRAKLFELGAVLNEENGDDGSWILELKMSERDLMRFMKQEKLAPELLEPMPVINPATAAIID
jgi:GTP-binding protein HflX